MKDKTDTLTAAWKAVLKDTPNSDAVQSLVDILALQPLSSRAIGRSTEAVQGVANASSVDYFRRMLAEQLAPDEVRDQTVLADIEKWNADRGGPMLERLFNATERAGYVSVWEHFGWRIEVEDLYVLAERLFSETLLSGGAAANMQDRPALLAVWRRLNRRRFQADAQAWINRQMTLALPVSLRFADDLLYYWASEKYGVVADDAWDSIRRHMLEEARRVYRTPEALLSAVIETDKDRQGYALLHFVRPPSRRDHVDIEPRDREWLAPLLIDAARLRPHFVIRNLIAMVGDHDVWARLPETDPETLMDRVYKLRPDQVETIFGSHATSLLQLLASNEPRDDMEKSAALQAKRLLERSIDEPSKE